MSKHDRLLAISKAALEIFYLRRKIAKHAHAHSAVLSWPSFSKHGSLQLFIAGREELKAQVKSHGVPPFCFPVNSGRFYSIKSNLLRINGEYLICLSYCSMEKKGFFSHRRLLFRIHW